MPLLPALVALPLFGALLVGLTPRGAASAQRALALLATLATAVLGLWLCVDFDGSRAQAQLVFDAPWFTLPGGGSGVPVHVRLGLDGLSVLMVGLTSLLGPVVVLSTYGHIRERVKEFMVWLLVMQAGMLGVFLSLDLVLFYVFWEASLVPLYFIIGIWGGERRLYATIKFFLYTVAGSLVMMVAVIALLWRLGTADIEKLTETASSLPLGVQGWMFAAFALAFAIKVPMFPFHTWLPDAHTEAPTAGSVILAAILLKLGAYGFIRFALPLFPDAAHTFAPAIIVLSLIAIIYGAIVALVQPDLKRLVAYSSVSHMGFVTLGLFVFTEQGIQGAILQMINHGLITGGLFLLVGVIYERTHDRTIAKMGGLAARVPIWAATFGFFVFASAGLPGLSGFVGEFLSLVGTFLFNPAAAAVATFCMILAAGYLLWMYQRVIFGEVSEFLTGLGGHVYDVTPVEMLTLVPLATLIVLFGIQPGLLLALVQGSVKDTFDAVGHGAPIAVAPEFVVIALLVVAVLIVGRTVSAALSGGGPRTEAVVAEGGAAH